MSDAKLQYYVLICNKKNKKKFLEILADHGAVGTETVYGRGSAKAGALAGALGFETEEHKVVLAALIPTPNAITLTDALMVEHDFQSSNTGIAFSIPVEGLTL